jgi:peptidoglycan/LPS O-acetylase OafA/YrhL
MPTKPNDRDGEMSAKSLSFIPAIAGLRGLAVMLVIANHYNTRLFSDWLIGNVGVAVFFCISGFLAYYVLYRDETKWGSINYTYFMIRRVLRIWPLYFAIIALTYFTEAHFGNVQTLPLSLFTFTFNFDLAAGHHPPLPSLAILWSIAVEEQFYVLAPLMYVLLRSRYRYVFVAAVCIAANVARLYYLGSGPAPVGGGLYYMTYAYADTFIAGALLASYRTGRPENVTLSPALSWFMFLACAGLLTIAARLWALGPIFPVGALPYLLIPVAGAGLLWSAIAGRTALTAVLGSAPARALGELSFGIYVSHTYVQNYLYHHVRAGPPVFSEYGPLVYTAGTFACTAVLATALYFLIERQGLRIKDLFAPKASGHVKALAATPRMSWLSARRARNARAQNHPGANA